MSSKTLSAKKTQPLQLVLPATSANLGPGFDAAAVALGLSIKISARVAEADSIAAVGRDAEICRKLENHLIFTTYREILRSAGKSVAPLALRIDNQIPIGKGCGSSASARLAGIALAVHFGGLRWSDSRIVGEASRLEHHPDNAAACWMGGLAVARMSGDAEAQVASITPKGQWPLLLAIPPQPLSTEEARRVLPVQYSRADAVINIQNSMLLLAAFLQGRRDLLPAALDDRIHQPYRAALCPLLPALRELAGTPGILGAVLSGAGPSVLVFLDPKARLSHAKIRIAKHLRARGLTAELISTRIRKLGAGQEKDWKRKQR
jgi:homoserine kinase